MIDYIITTSSTIDLDYEEVKRLNLSIINYSFVLDGKEYPDDFGVTFKIKDFYEAILNGGLPTTSQVNYQKYYDFFKSHLEQKKSIIHICLSSGLTGSTNNAKMAAEDLNKEYENKVYIVDSLLASGGQGMLVFKALEFKKQGNSFEKTCEYVEELKHKINAWFYTTDLTQFIRGGRISKASGMIASSLNIVPLLNIDKNGKLNVQRKCLGKKKALIEIVSTISKLALNGVDYEDCFFINHSHCMEDALKTKEALKKKFPKCSNIMINEIGTVIGSHTGIGTIGIFFVGKERD